LQLALIGSIQKVDARTGKPFIPNGPEDVVSSSMARGTTPAVWPILALQGAEAESLLNTSFVSYYRAWLAPQDGGFRHYQGTLWPYAGLGIAHAMLRLGMLEQVWQVLDWTLAHQTLPGTYAWGEAINPVHGGLELGDMPHSWAAAELVSVLRDMLLNEQDGVLVVNSGTPEAWLDAGHHVILRDAPTQYGPASIELLRSEAPADGRAPELNIRVSGAPPRGWRVRIPANARQVVIDDAPAVPQSGVMIQLATGPHTLRVLYADTPISNAAN
jgi:hypothetical protein